MQRKLCLVLSLTITWICVDSNSGYDSLDDDILADIDLELEEEDLDEIGKLLDAETSTKPAKLTAKGFRKQTSTTKGLNGKHNLKDLRKIYKLGARHNQGSYNDKGLYANANGVIGKAVAVTGNEDRKYRKGTKSRGFHRVHHKDEYKKDKVIYEDDETSGKIKKVGAKGFGFKIGAGAGLNQGRYHNDRSKSALAKRGYLDQGSFDKEANEYENSNGFDGAFNSEG